MLNNYQSKRGVLFVVLLIQLAAAFNIMAQTKPDFIAKKALPKSRLELSRRSQNGSFYDVVGRKSAAYGYEHRGMEAWVYPMKLVDDFQINFRVEGYNLGFRGSDLLTQVDVRPEATTFTYSHAAFTVKQIVYAPVDEQGLIMLLDISTTLPMTVEVSFRPKLALSWPGNLMTGSIGFDEKNKYYFIGEEMQKYYGIVGSPTARDVSLMPYQEEPQDVPARYQIQISPETARQNFIPIVIAGSTDGRKKAEDNYNKLLANALPLYENNVAYYENLLENTTEVTTPDDRLNTAFAWAKIGVDKGMATNPFLGTGLLAGFRTSGDSERPGFAWFFGRDAMWTALAINSYGDYAATKTALGFLKQFQRADGKIPHEISQSASLVDWWKGYPYAWASTDATPLYVIVNADYFRQTGDLDFLRQNWDSIQKAYRYEEATDTDNNGLIENTKFGHGWIEGGALYPPHEEVYLQGVWIEASRNLVEMAEAMNDQALAEKARANAEKTRQAMERTYWLEDKGFYAYATKKPFVKLPTNEPPKADPGPNRERRQARMDELANAAMIDEETVLPAVPLWWRTMADDRAQKQIDHLGSAKIATDWGARILANDSRLYDPLSYHNGSVWPLFTGWQSLAAYNYGRSHVGNQALMATALLTYANALGYVTELISGDFNAPFGRSSHHQVWSEAMVITPVMRGMLGIEITDGGKTVRFAPQLPANWNDLQVRGVRAGNTLLDFTLKRANGKLTILAARRGAVDPNPIKLILAPAFPLDAKIRSVTVGGKPIDFKFKAIGDVQQPEITFDVNAPQTEVIFVGEDGTDVYLIPQTLVAGAESSGLRIIRSQARENGLSLVLEGLGGRDYQLSFRSPRQFQTVEGVQIKQVNNDNSQLIVSFKGSPESYEKREILIPYQALPRPEKRRKT